MRVSASQIVFSIPLESPGKSNYIRRFNVPPTEVELDHGDEALKGIIDGGHGEEGLRMRHEAVQRWLARPLV